MANSKLALEVAEMVRVLTVYYQSTLPNARLKKCTVALLFDIVDFMMDMGTDFVTEQAECQRTNRSVDTTFSLMSAPFSDVAFTKEDMQRPLTLEVRELCPKHQETLSRVNWPQDAWECSCRWHPRLRRVLESFEADAVPTSEKAALCRGLVKRSTTASGAVGGGRPHMHTVGSVVNGEEVPHTVLARNTMPNDMQFDAQGRVVTYSLVGGFKDKLKADCDQQRFSHLRAAKHIKAQHTKKAESELKLLLVRECVHLPHGQAPCMCAGTALGYLREECPFNDGWIGEVNQAKLETAYMYHAWCCAKGGGTFYQKNEDWMTAPERLTKKSMKIALSAKVVQLMVKAGYGPTGAPTDGSEDPSASGPRRSSRLRSGAAGKGAAGTPRAMTAAEKKAVEKCVPKGGSFHNDVALMAACPKVEVASDGRLMEYPELLPTGMVQLQMKEIEAADWPSRHLGVVEIQQMFKFSMTTKHVPTVGSFGLECLVCDGGQHIESQLRKCDTIAMHMAYRVQDSLTSTDLALEASARIWFEHYGANQNQRPSWMSVLAHLRESNVPEWIWDHESQIVRAQLGRGQPVSPYQSAMLLQDFARGVVEAKLFVDKHGAFHMSLGFPETAYPVMSR